MRRSSFCLILLLLAQLFYSQPPACAATPYSRSYQQFLDLARQSLRENDLKNAVLYAQTAASIDPASDEPRKFLNYLRRLQAGQVFALEQAPATIPDAAADNKTKKRIAVSAAPIVTTAAATKKNIATPSAVPTADTADARISKQTVTVPVTASVSAAAAPQPSAQENPAPLTTVSSSAPYVPQTAGRSRPNITIPPAQKKLTATQGTLELNDALWKKQPNMPIAIEFGKSILVRGKNVKQALVITEGVLAIERISNDVLKITSVKNNSTYVHVWDARGRWTFNVKTIFPQPERARGAGADWGTTGEESVSPFRLSYTNNWGAYYTGKDLPHLKRDNLSFEQWAGAVGETPYGKFDASLNWYKYSQSTELVGQRLGLTDGHIGPFDDFTIRGYDSWKKFSDLTLPGRDFRGFMLESYAFNRNVLYTYLTGKDRANFLYYGPGMFEVKESYMEGARVVLFPEGKHQYGFNYMSGHGSAREDYLPPTVFSVETTQKVDRWDAHYEYARDAGNDSSQYGQIGYLKWDSPEAKLIVSGRDLPKNFYTATDQPVSQGEAGGNVILNWNPGDALRLNSDLDIYRDRKLGNPDHWMAANFEWGTNATITIDPFSSWASSIYVDSTPQLLDSRKSLRIDNTYSRTFKFFGDRDLTVFVGNTDQWSRFPDSATSEYDRFTLTSGFRIPLWKRLSYFAQYEYSWAKDIYLNVINNPAVLTTGFTYSRQLFKDISGNVSLTYHDEQNTGGNFSFLSGQDTMRGTWGFNYTPSRDLQFYVDGELSNVWAENNSQAAYNEASIRFGVQTGWDTPFRWNPSATISGIVFKDVNGNGQQDKNEPGIPGVIIHAGKRETVTDNSGHYRLKVSAKKVRVTPDIDSIPKGFVFSTAVGKDIPIVNGGSASADFGLTTCSSIYGVVFYDKNNNGQVDAGEKGIANVRIILDSQRVVLTDFEGMYTFDGLIAGQHTIKLDINSLPMEYLPVIRVENTVEVTEGTTYVFQIPLRKKSN